ncbi:unnamed protein product [Closterium sp. NIES-54]
MAREAQLVVYVENAMYSPPDDPKKADVIVRDPESGWAAREAARRKDSNHYRHTEHVGFFALAVETYGAQAPSTAAFLKLLSTAAAQNCFRTSPLAKTAKKVAAHFRQRWAVMPQRRQATAFHVKARAGIEAAHPQAPADPWPLQLGHLLHTLE